MSIKLQSIETRLANIDANYHDEFSLHVENQISKGMINFNLACQAYGDMWGE